MIQCEKNRKGKMTFYVRGQPFPEELWLHIFSRLNPQELCTISLVCSVWRRIASDKRLWQALAPPGITLETEDGKNELGARLALANESIRRQFVTYLERFGHPNPFIFFREGVSHLLQFGERGSVEIAVYGTRNGDVVSGVFARSPLAKKQACFRDAIASNQPAILAAYERHDIHPNAHSSSTAIRYGTVCSLNYLLERHPTSLNANSLRYAFTHARGPMQEGIIRLVHRHLGQIGRKELHAAIGSGDLQKVALALQLGAPVGPAAIALARRDCRAAVPLLVEARAAQKRRC
jgi:hypothetical protein